MGIKGLYGYCLREIKDSYKTINILEEIGKYERINHVSPLVIINISTLCYYYELKVKDMLCGYQINKIKHDFENFLSQLKDAGAELEFVFKKAPADDSNFVFRRYRDYDNGCYIINSISKLENFEKLMTRFRFADVFPYNPLIQVALIQSAEKFGLLHGCNQLKGKPTIQQTNIAREKGAAFIMGLDTYYFLIPGPWQIWCDSDLDMEAMTIRQLDPNVVLDHFQLKPEQIPLFACLVGDLKSSYGVQEKVLDHFGRTRFPSAAKFVRSLKPGPIDEMLRCAIQQILAMNFDSSIITDFKNTMKTFEIDETAMSKINDEILELVENDFLSIVEEVLLNTPIFINPAFLDMQKTDMKCVNILAKPLIQKTAGILLKNLGDEEPRKVLILPLHEGPLKEKQFDVISPDFEVPSLQDLLAGEMSTMEKMEILSFVTGIVLSDLELPVIPEEYIVDTVILLYLIENKSLTFFESRCIMKTIVDARSQVIPLEAPTEYPTKISERAFRCCFLYSKMYLIFHSCLSSLGMKNFCPEIMFDGVYFQQIFLMNHEDKNDENNNDGELQEEDEELSQTEIIDEFADIIRL